MFRYFDKGTGWVIDTPENYERKVMEHLGDTETFTPINEPTDTSLISDKIEEINITRIGLEIPSTQETSALD